MTLSAHIPFLPYRRLRDRGLYIRGVELQKGGNRRYKIHPRTSVHRGWGSKGQEGAAVSEPK